MQAALKSEMPRIVRQMRLLCLWKLLLYVSIGLFNAALYFLILLWPAVYVGLFIIFCVAIEDSWIVAYCIFEPFAYVDEVLEDYELHEQKNVKEWYTGGPPLWLHWACWTPCDGDLKWHGHLHLHIHWLFPNWFRLAYAETLLHRIAYCGVLLGYAAYFRYNILPTEVWLQFVIGIPFFFSFGLMHVAYGITDLASFWSPNSYVYRTEYDIDKKK